MRTDKRTRALEGWLHEKADGPRLWQVTIGKGIGEMIIEAWPINGRVVLVQWFPARNGWELYTAAPGAQMIPSILEDAERRVGLRK